MNDHAVCRVLRSVAAAVLVALGAATGACSKADEAVPSSPSIAAAPKANGAAGTTASLANAAPAPAVPVSAMAPVRTAASPVDAPKATKQSAPPTVPPRVEVVSVVLSRAPQFTRDDLLALQKARDTLGADHGPIHAALEHWMEFQEIHLVQSESIDETAEKLRSDVGEVPTETLRIARPDAEKPIDEQVVLADTARLKDKRALLVAVFGADRNLDFDRTRDTFVVKVRIANQGARAVTYLSGTFDVGGAAGRVFLRADFESAGTIPAGGSIDIDSALPLRASAAHLVALEKSLATAKWTFKADRTVYGK